MSEERTPVIAGSLGKFKTDLRQIVNWQIAEDDDQIFLISGKLWLYSPGFAPSGQNVELLATVIEAREWLAQSDNYQ